MADKFQERCLETWHSVHFYETWQRLHAVLGLAGESGELTEILKKDSFKPGHESTREHRLDELGDVFYYLCVLAHLDDCTIEELSRMNHEKLRDGHGWLPDYTTLTELKCSS
jgi:NTP pyrophosphatase (non-canonical NTP hydrolase)